MPSNRILMHPVLLFAVLYEQGIPQLRLDVVGRAGFGDEIDGPERACMPCIGFISARTGR